MYDCSLPQHVQDVSRRLYSKKYIWYSHILKFALFRVWKVHFGFPNCLDESWIIEIKSFSDGRIVQAGVIPMLTQI